MSDLFKFFGLCISSAILLVILKRSQSEMSVMLKVTVSIALMGACALWISPIITYVSAIFESTNIGKYGEILIKALCISLISGVCAMICRDAGEEGISQFALLAGRIQIVIISLPVIDEILEISVKLLEFV